MPENNLWTKQIQKHINYAWFMTNYPKLYLIMHAIILAYSAAQCRKCTISAWLIMPTLSQIMYATDTTLVDCVHHLNKA